MWVVNNDPMLDHEQPSLSAAGPLLHAAVTLYRRDPAKAIILRFAIIRPEYVQHR